MISPNVRIQTALVATVILVAWIAGCAVGPDYHRPDPVNSAPMPGTFDGAAAAITNTGAWKTAEPSAHLSRGKWWDIFDDAELDRLETLATEHNQQLAAALATYQQARSLVKVARADYYPQVSANPNASRQRISENLTQRGATNRAASTFTTYTLPADASWELDLWGRIRRQVEGSKERFTAAGDDLEAAKLSVQAEVAMDYFSLCSLDAQNVLLQTNIDAYRRSFDLTQTRHQGGIATDLDVSQAETQLKTTEAQLPAIDLQRANLRHVLATLCGRPATGFQVNTTNTALKGAPRVPVSLPSDLLEHRPDIAAAEHRMAAANADIGVATGAFYPRVMLSGMAGFQSIDTGTLFDWPSRVWAVGPSIQLPIFTGGRNRAQLASARAAYDSTVANYRQTVLGAFQDVEDQLAAMTLLLAQYEAQKGALTSAQRTVEIANFRYKGGVSTYLEVATAHSAALTIEQSVVRLGADRLSASVSLIKALGGGWRGKD